MMGIREICLVTASIVALSISAEASAQTTSNIDGDPQPLAEADGSRIGDIVVTANRRSERAQTVPISVAAISGEDALMRGVTDTTSLANAVPGLRIDRAPGTATPFLRGVGTTLSTIGAEPSVSLYVDDVYIPASYSFFANFANIDRVEVLKGPQGTLFGRNATGGVIQVFTRNPTADAKADVTAGYANYDTVNGSLYLSGGLAEGLSANISAYGSHQGEGWGRNLTLNKDAFKTNWNYGGRVKLLFEPSSDTSVLLTADHDKTVSSLGFLSPVPGTVAYGAFPGAAGFYDMVDDQDPLFRSSQSGVSAKISHETPFARLVSVTAYRHAKQFLRQNSGGSQSPFIHLITHGYNKTFTQELQLLSPQGSKISWLAGLFYMRDQAAYDPIELNGLAFGPAPIYTFARQTTNSYSGFGQATLPLAENTHLTLGLRYTSDNKKIRASWEIPGVGSGVSPNSPQSKRFSKLTWRAALDHQFSPDLMVYASYNRGFRSGGYNLVVSARAPIGAPVAPEVLDAFAIGEKAEFFDRRLQINTEAFYYKFKNIQVNTIVTGGVLLSNAAAASIKGVDIDIKAVPVKNLTLTAAFEYLHGRYDSYPNGVLYTYSPGCRPGSSNCASLADLSGNRLPFAAPFSASFVVDYLLPTAVGDFNVNVAYNHGGNYFFDPDNGLGQLSQSIDKQRDLNLVNASLRWSSMDRKYDITLWGKNITDQKYLSAVAIGAVVTKQAPAAPATYGATFGVHF